MKTFLRGYAKVMSIVLTLFMLCGTLAVFTVSAADTGADVYEAVLLVDVSESMNRSDPAENGTRLSMEAMRAFAYNRPADCDFFVSIVAYNDSVAKVAEKLNLHVDADLAKFEECLDKIQNAELDGITSWLGLTNIGSAMDMAHSILENSTANKKAAMLFTDGKVDLFNKKDEEASAQLAKDTAEKFKDEGTRVFCIGLNNDGSVDEAFLNSLSSVTGGETKVCEDKNELDTLFNKIFSLFVDDTFFDDEEPIEYPVSPDVPTNHKIDIYGDVVRETNISLSCPAIISSFTVKSPDGTVVVDVNSATGKNEVDTTKCKVTQSANGMTVNIKLIKPADGVWEVEMYSQTEGKVKISEIISYNLDIICELPADKTEGDKITLHASLFNKETNQAIKNARVYDDSIFSVTITYGDSSKSESVKATKSEQGDGFDFTVKLDKPGNCTFTFQLKNGLFEVESTGTMSVAEKVITTEQKISVTVIILIVVGVLVVAGLFVVYKQSFISTNFRLRVVRSDEDGGSSEVVYSVNRMSNSKSAKPKMKLDAILSKRTFSTVFRGDMSDEDKAKMISTVCKRIDFAGVPFAKAVRVFVDKKKKTEFRGGSIATFTVKEGGVQYKFSIGSTSAFRETY